MLAALDISLTTGAAWGGLEGPPRSALYRLPSGEYNFDRALTIMRQTVMGLCKFNKVEIFLVEAAMPKVDREHSQYSAFLLMSLSAVAREAANTHGARVYPIACQTWRKTFIGSGNLSGDESKQLAMKRCQQLEWAYQDHNAAEALGLWYHGMATHFPRWHPQKASAFI